MAVVATAVTVATTLLAAGPVLADAVAEGGLRAALLRADPATTGVEVEVRTTASRADEVAAFVVDALTDGLDDRLAPPDVLISAGTVHLQGTPDGLVVPLAVLPQPSDDGATLVEVTRSLEAATSADDTTPVLLHRDALGPLGLAVEDRVRTDEGAQLAVVGAASPADVTDRRWWGEAAFRDGVVPGVNFTRVGPAWVADTEALEGVLGEDARVVVRVRTQPVLTAVDTTSLVALGRDVETSAQRLELRLQNDVGGTWTVSTPLVGTTRSTTVALAATRASVVAVTSQVAVLALYALGLAGRLLRGGREVETHLVRARGATPRQLGRVALVEGLVLVVPAVLLGPWLAVRATAALGRSRLVTDAGLSLVPRAGTGALLAAAVAGLACLVVLVLPAVASARATYAGVRGRTARRSPVGLLQRHGLDLGLVVLAGVGVWQLRAAGGPAAADPLSPGDLDPVLVAAPALGLLAGALLTLRLVPLLARLGERLAERRTGVVAGLSGWQTARRPDGVARPTLLLVLAVAIGVLATTYAATWRTSQGDQARAEVGADLVVEPDRQVDAVPSWQLAETLGVDGVTAVAPVWTGAVQLVGGAPRGTLVGVSLAPAAVAPRSDVGPTVPLSDLDVEPGRGVALPPGEDVTLTAQVEPDPHWPDLVLRATLVVRDGQGLVHRLAEQVLPDGGAPSELRWSLAGATAPYELLGVVVTVPITDPSFDRYVPQPGDEDRDDRVLVPGLGGQLFAVPTFSLRLSAPEVDGAPVAVTPRDWAVDPVDTLATVEGATDADGWSAAVVTGFAARGTTTDVVFAATAADAPLLAPAVVHPEVLAATGRAVGDELQLVVAGAPLRVEVVGTVDVVPGAATEDRVVLLDLDAIGAVRWAARRQATIPTSWHVTLDPSVAAGSVAPELATTWTAAPVRAPAVRTEVAATARRTSDPIAVGLQTALRLGALAAVVLALLGTAATAVASVRERAAEFALLQAVGVSIGQVGRWLASEVALVVTVGTLAGGALGAAMVWAVLPTIALAADGTLAVPAPLVVVPWAQLGTAFVVVVGAFALVPLALTRTVARAHVAEALRLGEDA